MEMSWALILNGRPQDGRDYLDAALRVEPKWTTWRYLMGGLAEFSMGRYAEAAAMLEKLEPERGVTSFWDFWGNYNGLRLLVVRLRSSRPQRRCRCHQGEAQAAYGRCRRR